MALADELAYVTATELAARIRRRELSPVEVVDAFIERIQARNDGLNALVYLGFDDARQRAREAEQALVSGTELGVLHGVPTAIKDLFDFQPGWPATFGGVRALKDFTLDISCAFAERIQRAGAIVLGKTNAPVMGFRGTCDNYLFGPSRNPFAPAKNTGGSSGGVPLRWPTGYSRSPRGPTGVARSASRPPGAASTATRPPSVASPTARRECPSGLECETVGGWLACSRISSCSRSPVAIRLGGESVEEDVHPGRTWGVTPGIRGCHLWVDVADARWR
jgi:hypothetical protein